MTEDEARAWCLARSSTTQFDRLERFGQLVVEENARQNLISPATCAMIWTRHIADSAQLLQHCRTPTGHWFDIGAGAGFPGMIIGILSDEPVTLVEPRAKRAAFLGDAAASLGLSSVSVCQSRSESAEGEADVISARAVATIPDLIAMTSHLRHAQTRMILPRGRNGAREVDELPAKWRRMFHVEQSVTDPESVIVIADGVPA